MQAENEAKTEMRTEMRGNGSDGAIGIVIRMLAFAAAVVCVTAVLYVVVSCTMHVVQEAVSALVYLVSELGA